MQVPPPQKTGSYIPSMLHFQVDLLACIQLILLTFPP